MKIELTKSQISYLKSLDSKKKKRKFLLDCLIENICVEETQSIKPSYYPDKIELITHNIEQRKLSEQGSELLKFDMLEKEDKNLYSEIALLFLDKGFSSFLSLNDAMEIEKLVLKYNENAN
jgi:hypothetical protein